MKQKIVPILLGSIFLGVLFDIFFYGKAPGVSFLLYIVVILTATIVLAQYYKRPLATPALLLTVPLIFFSAMVAVRANEFLTFLNVVTVMALLALFIDINITPSHQLRRYIKPLFAVPLAVVKEFVLFLDRVAATAGKKERSKHSPLPLPVIRGILLSVPIVVIFLLLFSSADLVFKRYVDSIFNIHLSLSPELFVHSLLIAFVTALFIGAFSLLVLHQPEATDTLATEQAVPKRLGLGMTEAYIVLGSVGTLFALFVLVQLAYLFGGQEHVVSSGITYATYARKGFFELIAVAAISMALILALGAATTRNTQRQKVIYKWLNTVLIVEVMLIMLSAFKRLNLYEGAYGFTVLRLYSHLFIMLLAVMFVLLLVHIWKERQHAQFAFQLFVAALVFLATLNIISPDAVVARQNLNRFDATGKVDVYYLGGLSTDATPEVSRALSNKNTDLQKAVAAQLYVKQQSTNDFPDWQSFNVSRYHAKQILHDHTAQLDASKDYRLDPTSFQ